MPPFARALLVLILAPLLGAPAERLPTPDPLRAAGWQKGGWPGIKPAQFEALPDGGLRITGGGAGEFRLARRHPGRYLSFLAVAGRSRPAADAFGPQGRG